MPKAIGNVDEPGRSVFADGLVSAGSIVLVSTTRAKVCIGRKDHRRRNSCLTMPRKEELPSSLKVVFLLEQPI